MNTSTLSVSELFEHGRREHQAGRRQAAAEAYRQVLTRDPAHADALQLMGVLAREGGRADIAETFVRRAIACNGANAGYHCYLGILLNEFGRHDEAEASLLTALRLKPDFAAAHARLGATLLILGRATEAETALRTALRLSPEIADAHRNLGGALLALGRPAEAEGCYREAIRLRPTDDEALSALGFTRARLGRPAEAEAALRLALQLQPASAAIHNRLGAVLCDLGRTEEGAGHLREVARLRPDDPGAHCNLAVALVALDRREEAEARYREALRLDPEHLGALNNLGTCLCALGRPGEAEAVLKQAVRLAPELASVHRNLGGALFELGRLDEAETAARQALRLRPDAAADHNSLGTILSAQGRPAEGEACFREALRRAPGDPEAQGNLGLALLNQCRATEAEEALRAALPTSRAYAETQVTLATALLLSGQLEEGWEAFEWRWRTKYMAPGERGFSAPRWRGEPIEGKTLLLHAEQGHGDTLHFCRYAALLGAGARVVLEVQPALAPLMGTLDGVSQVVARGETLPAFDLHAPLMSVAHAFGTTLETIPNATPYLRAAASDAARWAKRLAPLSGLKVGLVWAGEPRTEAPALAAVDRRRSVTLAGLAPLAGVAGVSFVSLQKGGPAAQAAEPPPRLTLHDFTGELDDFADTAALIEALDLVISVDTSVAHLTGALGKPVWLLNRFDTDWRWLLGRDDSPWYPTLRQFRQRSPGDWASVIEAVREALRSLAAGDRSQLVARSAASGSRPRLTEHRPLEIRAPDIRDIKARFDRGHAFSAQGRPAEAEACYREVLRRQPDHVDALTGLGVACSLLGRPVEGEAPLREAVRLRPDTATAHNSLGVVLLEQHRLEEAEACFRDALRLDPQMPNARANVATALYNLHRLDEAEQAARAALAAHPDRFDARMTLAVTLLMAGRLSEGWEAYEWRWRAVEAAALAPDVPGRSWRGERIGPGETLLVVAEQGLGDTLQFCRYVPLISEGGRVIVQVQPALKRLLATLPGDAEILARGEQLPVVDWRCPMLSLPFALAHTAPAIPTAIPYLAADTERAARWRQRLGAAPGVRVGLVWAGDPRKHQPGVAAVDARRSIALDAMAPLAGIDGVSFVSLQKGEPAAQAADRPRGLTLHDFTDELNDFADTAALVEALDLVISVDTSVAHLAGALGKPVWLLNRFDTCWRWLLDRDDSPWYPTLRQFRQPSPGDWASVIAEVRETLRLLAAGDRKQLWPRASWDAPA